MPGSATATISAIVVDDEQLARDELAYLLKDIPDIEIVATGANGLEAVRLIEVSSDGTTWSKSGFSAALSGPARVTVT
mgnify:CR=1 FL=1